MRRVLGLAVAALLAGCATNSTHVEVWERLDGKPLTGTPELAREYQVATTICMGERQKADLSAGSLPVRLSDRVVEGMMRDAKAGDVYKGCMAQRGYVLGLRPVPVRAATMTDATVQP